MQTSRTIRQTLQLSDNADIREHLSPFEDSSHQIFMVEENNDKRVIKVPNPSNRHASDFWQWMSTCFDVSLETQIARFPQLYPLIERLSPIRIPTLQGQQPLMDGTLLTQTGFLPGRPLTPSDLTDPILQSLARHMAAMHRQTSPVFGDLVQNKHHTAQCWMERLRKGLACIPGIHPEIDEAFNHSRFGLIMPDFRWDQFLFHEGELALTDLDAIVYGPVELDWVLLEYLLTPEQASLFIEAYLDWAGSLKSIPKIAKVREGYRTLLFLMNVLGEKDYQTWLRQPTLFD